MVDRLIKLAVEVRLRRTIATSFKEASQILDKMSKQAKKPLGTN